MTAKSKKEDIELPLLSKGQRHEEEGKPDHGDHNKFGSDHWKPKYFDTSLISRAVFGWVDHFLNVSLGIFEICQTLIFIET